MKGVHLEKADISLKPDASIIEALKKLDKAATKSILVLDERDHLIGVISDGDIRRYILKGKSLEGNISGVYNPKPLSILQREYTIQAAKELLIAHEIQLLPVIDDSGKLVDFVRWDQVFAEGESVRVSLNKLDIPVVIMAGGKGTRLEPFTKILPKPLIPIGDIPIMERIINEFVKFGMSRFLLTLNYRSEMIIAYFNSIEKNFHLEYFKEGEGSSGTAGSLTLMEKELQGPFFVSNCDIIVKADYYEAYQFHRQSGAALTIISSIQHHKIPYGVITFKEEGCVTQITEKPEFSFTINTGVYILERACLDYIPKGGHFDMTTLIAKVMADGKKVVTYPVNENDYIDIGQWEEYKKAMGKLNLL